MLFRLYVDDSVLPVHMDAGSADHAGDLLLIAAERGYFRGIMLDHNGCMLNRQAPVPFETVYRVEYERPKRAIGKAT